ncbi:RWP-RK domain-containing protein, partial [Tribonema minus]
RASSLTLADLERYYSHPLAEASRELGLSATMLKKVCRSFGIKRWPHRQLASI